MDLIIDNIGPILIILLVVYIIGSFTLEIKQQSRLLSEKRINRGTADICAFARSFDYRAIDTKIIREVWNEIQLNLISKDSEPFPIQASDDFNKDYFFDPDDLDFSYWDICDRLGIDTENGWEKNPYTGKVKTVKDLVLFIHHQPRLAS